MQTEQGQAVLEQLNFETLRFYMDEYGVADRLETAEKITLLFEIAQRQKKG